MKKYIFIICSFLFCFTFIKAEVPVSEMIEISGGRFTMGNGSYPRESPARLVSVAGFYMSKYAITNTQFADFINQYGSVTAKDGEYAGKSLFITDSWGIVNDNGVWKAATGFEQYPMIKVTWYGANEFCKWTGGRLPSEAEWEYAAKGGSSIKSYIYSGSSTASSVAWYYDNSGHTNKMVGTKSANSLGIFDMSGNVYQWCSDWFGRYNDFGTSGDVDPKGPETGISKVIRGGYRSIGSSDLHLTARESLPPDESYNFVGFRIVKDFLTPVIVPHEDLVCVYPNPASKSITVSSKNEIQRIEIIDNNGRVLYQDSKNDKTISLSQFSDGMYVIRISSGGINAIKKFVVNK
ncbi:MAG: SUMF1/EgtB/PvdO family nonheme iron enzyme [Paludibacter sp.]|nr:SUMF1/EgtB/PvdO family nonheme iron enzyme [Paludibacter sp.]